MKLNFGDSNNTKQSRAEKIRSLFVSGTTINAHTEVCANRYKLWSESEDQAAAMREHRAEVRDALGVLVDGVPFAGPVTMGKHPKWRQSEFWVTEEAYFVNWSGYRGRGGQNITIANNISDHYRDRNGGTSQLMPHLKVEEYPD